MAVKTLCRLQTSLGAAEVAILELGDRLTNPEHSIAVGERHLGCQGVHVYKKQTRVAAPFHPSEDESVRNSQGALPPPVGRLPTPMPRSIPTSSKDLALSPPVPALSPRAPAQANEGLNPRGWPGPSKQAFPGPEAQAREDPSGLSCGSLVTPSWVTEPRGAHTPCVPRAAQMGEPGNRLGP